MSDAVVVRVALFVFRHKTAVAASRNSVVHVALVNKVVAIAVCRVDC